MQAAALVSHAPYSPPLPRCAVDAIISPYRLSFLFRKKSQENFLKFCSSRSMRSSAMRQSSDRSQKRWGNAPKISNLKWTNGSSTSSRDEREGRDPLQLIQKCSAATHIHNSKVNFSLELIKRVSQLNTKRSKRIKWCGRVVSVSNL